MKSQPTLQQERNVSLDMIRGIALFGILLINVPAYLILTQSSPEPEMTGINGLIQLLVDLFVEKKFFCMFSFLFGAGFYLFLSRAEARGDRYFVRMSRRLGAMLLFGILDIIFLFWGDILTLYALLGFLLLPFYKRSAKVLLGFIGGLSLFYVIANVLAILLQTSGGQSPVFYDVFGTDLSLIFIMFLLGLYAAKTGAISGEAGAGRVLKATQAASFLLFGMLSGCLLWLHAQPQTETVEFVYSSLQGLAALPGALFYLSTLFRLLKNRRMQSALFPIGQMGRMAFTNYIGQYVIGSAIIALAELQVVSPLHALYIALAIYVIELIVSNLWLRAFTYGPLEYVWRKATYGKWKTTPATVQND